MRIELPAPEVVNPLIPEWFEVAFVLFSVLPIALAVVAVVLAVRAGWPGIHTFAWVLVALAIPVVGPLLVIAAVVVTRRQRAARAA